MVSRKRKNVDPVLPDQGGRETRVDPGRPAREEAVRLRAYQLYERRGRKDGHDLQDWFDAENQLRADGRDSELAAKAHLAATILTTAMQ